MNKLNAAVAVLIYSGLDLSNFNGLVELTGYTLSSEALLVDSATTEYDMGVEIYHDLKNLYVADIQDIGMFQLLHK